MGKIYAPLHRWLEGRLRNTPKPVVRGAPNVVGKREIWRRGGALTVGCGVGKQAQGQGT